MVLKQVATLQLKPEFREAQLSKFRACPEMDIVITTALIPNERLPSLLMIW